MLLLSFNLGYTARSDFLLVNRRVVTLITTIEETLNNIDKKKHFLYLKPENAISLRVARLLAKCTFQNEIPMNDQILIAALGKQ